MEAATERRAPHEPRVPLDVLVEIAPEGTAESFEADGVNVGPGGISMRSPILPDIGARLRCRFNSPHDGSSVDAACEVVWAQDSGPNLGEFGLRFRELAPTDAEAIRRLVDSWHSYLDEPEEPGPPTVVSLHLDGVGQPVEAELLHRADDALVVEQPLAFLRIGTGIAEDGRHGRLEAVDLRLDGDTPRLVLTIGYADERSSEPALGELDADSTLMDAPAPPYAEDEASTGPVSIEEASTGPVSIGASSLMEGEPPFEPVSGLDDTGHAFAEPLDADDGPRAADGESCEAAYSKVEGDWPDATGSEVDEAAPDPRDAAALAAFRSSARVELRKAGAVVRAHAAKLRIWLVAAWSKAAPSLRAWWARMRHFAGDVRRRAGLWMRALRGRLKKQAGEQKRSATRRATRAPKRRTTRPPSKRDAAPGRGRLRLRWVLLAVAAIVGVGVALAGRADEPLALAPKPPKPPAPSLEAADPELGDPGLDPASVQVEASGQAPSAEESVAVEPEMPRALPDAPRGAGQIPAPSFPSLGDARPSAPGTVPSDSPYAAGEPSTAESSAGATSFGLDAVPGGRQFRIRLSRPVRDLRGEVTDDGFRVVLVGANAVEGARRIASVHPDVERARIENDGEQAVLTLRFVGQRRPPYRVHAAGDALFVTLGR